VQAAASGPASPVQPEPGALPIAAEPQSNEDAAARLDGSEGDEEAQQESSEKHARCPDAAHLAGSYSNPRPERRQDEDGWQLVTDQAAAGKLQGQPLLARAGQPAPYCAEREGFRNSECASGSDAAAAARCLMLLCERGAQCGAPLPTRRSGCPSTSPSHCRMSVAALHAVCSPVSVCMSSHTLLQS
jgi:hypothetical protein